MLNHFRDPLQRHQSAKRKAMKRSKVRAPGRLGTILEKRKEMINPKSSHNAASQESGGNSKWTRKDPMGKPICLPPGMPLRLKNRIMKNHNAMADPWF